MSVESVGSRRFLVRCQFFDSDTINFLAATIENLGIVSLENRYFLDTYKDSMFVGSLPRCM